jgi:hypothetical protein
VRFDLVDPVTLAVVGSPQIAKVGSPRTAFSACGADTPNPGQGVGESFLTDDGSIGNTAGTLLVTYSEPVAQAAGVILDTDTRSGSTFEQWTIDALDDSMSVLDTVVITAPDGPDNCNGGQGPGDGAADSFIFQRAQADIRYLVLRYTGTAGSIGLAFDSFSPTSIPPPPSATAAAAFDAPCFGDPVSVTTALQDGLAPFTYQWERSRGGAFEVIEGEFDPELLAPAIPGDSYRAIVTDALTRTTTTNAVTFGAVRPVDIVVSAEDAPGSGVFTPVAPDVAPYEIPASDSILFGWTDAEQYYHGPEPTLTLDRAHLFLTAGIGGQSLVMVYDGVDDNGGGRAEMSLEFTGASPDFTARDDPTGDGYQGGGTPTLRTRHVWDAPNTDGWAVGPLAGNWSATLRFSDEFTGTPTIEGLSSWAVYSADGSSSPLPLAEDQVVRIDARCGCPGDLAAPLGELTFADISAFLAAFAGGEPGADFAEPYGSLTFADVSAFLAAFAAGCP